MDKLTGWIDVEQNSPDWEMLRTGKITCSQFYKLFMDESTQGFKDLFEETLYERDTGKPYPFGFKGNKHTERGHEKETLGIELYKEVTGQIITPGGFWIYDDYTGGSPDSHAGNDGLIEVKSREWKAWRKITNNAEIGSDGYIKSGFKPSKAEYWQILGQMLVSGRSWGDLVITPPDEKYKVLIYRIERDEAYIDELKDRLAEVNKLIEKEIEKLQKFIK